MSGAVYSTGPALQKHHAHSCATWLAGTCAYLTQLTITLGLQRVGATLGTALSYLTLVWGMGLGFLIFHEVELDS